MFSFFKKIHTCNYKKPIVSKYVSFNRRKIIYECSCGKRDVKVIYKDFSHSFPIQTNLLITEREFNDILNNKKAYKGS